MTSEQKDTIAAELRRYLAEEVGLEVGAFEAADLTDFIVDNIGPWFYNQGVLDARAKLGNTMDGILDDLALLEKSSPLDR